MLLGKTDSLQPVLMFVRVKRLGTRRYFYLVEGVRNGGRVSQKTLCYLGPVSRFVAGVPNDIRKKVSKRFHVDWNGINDSIGRIPITFEELSEARLAHYTISIALRSRRHLTQGDRPRIEGELSSLSKLAALRFREMFEEIGEGKYRMR